MTVATSYCKKVSFSSFSGGSSCGGREDGREDRRGTGLAPAKVCFGEPRSWMEGRTDWQVCCWLCCLGCLGFNLVFLALLTVDCTSTECLPLGMAPSLKLRLLLSTLCSPFSTYNLEDGLGKVLVSHCASMAPSTCPIKIVVSIHH